MLKLLRRLAERLFASRKQELPHSGPTPYQIDLMDQIRRCVFDADAGQLVRIEALMRRWDEPWSWLRADALPGFLSRSEDPSLLLRALVGHPSGYLREAALRELVRRDDPDLLRFLLFRSKDWVDEVAGYASAELAARLSLADLGALSDAFPLILALTRQNRRDYGEVVHAAHARLCSDAGETLIRDSEKWPIIVRRAAFEWVLPAVDDPGSTVLERALTDEDPVTRIAAVARLAQIPTPAAMNRIEQIARTSRGAVRAAALRALGERNIQRAESLVSAALIDSSRAVREVARALIKALDPRIDLRRFFIEASSARSPAVGAIHGLAETGRRADAEVLRPLLQSERIGLRKAALDSFAFLTRAAGIPECLAALSDVSPGVVVIAVSALEREHAALDFETFRQHFDELRHAHARKRCFRLITLGPKWAAPPLLLRMTGDESEPIRESALANLRAWHDRINRTSVRPSRTELDACSAALVRAAPQLPGDLARELGFVFRTQETGI